MDVRRSAAILGVFEVRVAHQVIFLIHDRLFTADQGDGIAVIQSAHLVRRQKLFATLSSDEFKKTAAAKKNLCGCRSNWRLEAKKSPVVPGK